MVLRTARKGATLLGRGSRQRCLSGAVRDELARTAPKVAAALLRGPRTDLAGDSGVARRDPVPNMDTHRRTQVHRIPTALGLSVAPVVARHRPQMARPSCRRF